MSTLMEIEVAAARLAPQHFSQLLEDLQDLALAREALSKVAAGEESSVAWEQLKVELDALHR